MVRPGVPFLWGTIKPCVAEGPQLPYEAAHLHPLKQHIWGTGLTPKGRRKHTLTSFSQPTLFDLSAYSKMASQMLQAV